MDQNRYRFFKAAALWTAFLLVCLGLAGCTASQVKPEQPARSATISLYETQSIGQTFTAHYDGLSGIVIYLEPALSGNGELTLHLRRSPTDDTDLSLSRLPIKRVTKPDVYRFDFSPQALSTQRDYFVFLEMRGSGAVNVGIAGGETYLNGALYVNDVPQDEQLAFGLVYRTVSLWRGLLLESLNWLKWLLAAVFLFVLPGWGLLETLWTGWSRLHWVEKLGLSGGLSLSIYPVLLLWTDLLNIHLGQLYAWLPGGMALIWLIFRHGVKNRRCRLMRFSLTWPDLALLGLFALIFLTRFWVIRTIDLPLWGDSYQHTVITQRIIEQGGLFDDWAPYVEIPSFTYHFGFHSAAAMFHWVVGLAAPRAVLITGQVLNAFAVIFLAAIALHITGRPWAGVATALFAGLLLWMPMIYTQWGRYTQLAGQVILPAVILLAWVKLEGRAMSRRSWIPAWLALGGLALTHYRVLIFAIAFLAAYYALFAREVGLLRLTIRGFWLGLGGAFIFLPWLVRLTAGKILSGFQAQITTPPSQLSDFAVAYNTIGDLTSHLPIWVWLGLPLAVAWGFWRRDKKFATLCLWWFLLLLAANPNWINLPGAGAISNFAYFIAAYIPASLILGSAIGWLSEPLSPFRPLLPLEQRISSKVAFQWGGVVLFLLAIGVGIYGGRQRVRDLDILPHTLAARPDIRAAEWIRANTPTDARFLVDSFPAYGGSVVVGADGGWWLPLLTNRQTSQPPINYANEREPWAGYVAWVNALTFAIQEKGVSHPEVLTMLRERNLRYIYIGQTHKNSGATLKVETLLQDARFRPIYHQDRVWIFAIDADLR